MGKEEKKREFETALVKEEMDHSADMNELIENLSNTYSPADKH